jgi:adenine-specific DNA-methyltransferase
LKNLLPEVNFANPKPISLMNHFLTVATKKNSLILDFFAGSGTTGQAVLELNKQDGGKRQFILATANEITDTTPNGIVNDVTSKRLKRVMTGECYDGTKDFKWNEENEPLGDNLDIYDIETVANFESAKDKTPFDVIDETLYGQEKLGVKEKIKWVCENFEGTQKTLEDK